MPKLRPSDAENARRVVRAQISAGKELNGVESDELAAAAGFTTRTLNNKMEHPETFSLGELQRIAQRLRWTPVQAASVIMGRPLTAKEVKDFILM